MTKLFEYQSKGLIKSEGIPVPRSYLVGSEEEAKQVAEKAFIPAVIKAQALVTGRKGLGAIKFANTSKEVLQFTHDMLQMEISGIPVNKVLVEEQLKIKQEFYAGLIVDDFKKKPVLIFSSIGGSGIEEIADKHPNHIAYYPISLKEGFVKQKAINLITATGVDNSLAEDMIDILNKLYQTAKKYEARSAEINPIGLTEEGQVIALDCRIVVDDYAVFRHPELNIEIAREFDRPPTIMESIAYQIEKNDYRGTFYFIQLETKPEGKGYVGFHGGGGGGSMMAMDALLRCGFKVPNFCDTSGNPPASKVYRAAKIILSQNNIEGYFHSGSGVASQEQYHTARGLVKAFREANLSIPAVIRIGGNSEKEAIDILHSYTRDLPGTVEAYGRDTDVDFCAQRLKELININTK